MSSGSRCTASIDLRGAGTAAERLCHKTCWARWAAPTAGDCLLPRAVVSCQQNSPVPCQIATWGSLSVKVVNQLLGSCRWAWQALEASATFLHSAMVPAAVGPGHDSCCYTPLESGGTYQNV